ncbi:hypothetical protein [Alkaliphilus transvaalensis]|uniref:hypothetical protein n=1 Tax=Alkaliphilus transvaalensis TaxID=114628 RepID=UPI0004787CF5|nr:hypothetical protein [Alkaliphilus transvaalensis]
MMNFSNKRLYSLALIIAIGLSIYSIQAYRNIQREMGKRYMGIHTNIETSLDLVKVDLVRFENNQEDKSILLPLLGKINELKHISYYTPPVNGIYPFLLREIEVKLIAIEKGGLEEAKADAALEEIYTTFELIEAVSKIIAEKIAEDNPIGFFREIESTNSKTFKRINEIYNDFAKK